MMSCPFLRETRVRSCRAAGIRKMIVESETPADGERCSSRRFTECAVFQQARTASPRSEKCPLLDERPVCYCSGEPVPHYVPWSEQPGHCGGDGYEYCDLWLSVARPRASGQPPKDPMVDGIAVPRDLRYSPNHLWLHSTSGQCHIGIDGFLARAFQNVDAISYVTPSGVHQPSVVLSVRGVDWALVFPAKLMITAVNTYLRHAPERLIADPYGAGWLFEAGPVQDGLNGLINGEQAYPWMKSEVERMTDFVHELDPATPNDGGKPSDDFIQHLSREQVLLLMHEFFASHAAWGASV